VSEQPSLKSVGLASSAGVTAASSGSTLETAVQPTPGELVFLPSAEFWRQEAPVVQGARYLAIDLAGSIYGLELSYVREIERLPAVTPLPNVPDWLLGAAYLRGEILSVVDLARFLGLTDVPTCTGRLLSCRAGGMEAGFLVERVRDIRELASASIRPPAGRVPGRVARYLAGVHVGDGRLTLLLDLPRLLQSPELLRFE
jgi:purine-binding chemotaxis protein CheW